MTSSPTDANVRDQLTSNEHDLMIAIMKYMIKRDGGVKIDYAEMVKETNGMSVKAAQSAVWRLKCKIFGAGNAPGGLEQVSDGYSGKKRGRPAGGKSGSNKRRKAQPVQNASEEDREDDDDAEEPVVAKVEEE